jgi:putative nucleotidyltransferase with HDIG domain
MGRTVAGVIESSPDVVLAHLDTLPTLPTVAVRLLRITSADGAGARDVIELLRNDQSLTARILSIANSAAAGVRGKVTTLDKAVPLIGFSAVRTIVLATSVFECFGSARPDRPGDAFDRPEFWRHALAVGCAARLLARQRPELGVAPEAAFVAGLLHDLGKVALDAVFPKAYDRIAAQADHSRGDVADFERSILGADHTVGGRRLAERWRLPRELQETIWLHHLAADALPSSVAQPALIGAVQLADTIAREQHLGYSGNHVFYEHSPRLAERLGFSAAQLAAVVEPLATDVAAQATQLGLGTQTPQALYMRAMTRANAELGKLNEALLVGNRRLAAGARYFRALREFEQRLDDWADPAAVVIAVAHAARSVLQGDEVAAFGVREDGSVVDVAWSHAAPEQDGHATLSVPEAFTRWALAPPGHAGATIGPAPPPVWSLVTALVDVELKGTPWLMSIFHDGRLAGGVVYASEEDQAARFAGETDELGGFLTSLGLALGRANAQSAARRLSEDLAETNRRLQHMQVELLRSRALSMIAEMAAGAGHELNTPLTVISGRAQMLGASVKDPEARRVLQTISDKAHECSGIVSELMDFARPRAPKLEAVDIEALLQDARAAVVAARELPPGAIRVAAPPAQRDAAGGPALVRADIEQLRSVFTELCHNAADAIAERAGGSVVLRYQHALQPDTIDVLIEDTGCGMAPAVLQRAFDPFFSHRKAGRSRGLGLPRAYRIIEAHGGRIWLESRPDEGTVAHVLLPRAPEARAAGSAGVEAPPRE